MYALLLHFFLNGGNTPIGIILKDKALALEKSGVMQIRMSVKLTMIFILLTFATLAYARSDNICTTQGWSVRYDMKLLGDSATFLVENISGETAFKVTCLVYFYDS